MSSVEIVEMLEGRVHLAVHVGDVLVAEDPGHLADRGRLPGVREELVPQPLRLFDYVVFLSLLGWARSVRYR
jgi:hypothetical protein